MPLLLKRTGTITEKGQVTVPKPVRDALGVGNGGRISFYVDENRQVSIQKEVEDEEEDPVVSAFLGFLSTDMKEHPDRIREFSPDLLARMANLVEDVEVDPDEPITGDVAL